MALDKLVDSAQLDADLEDVADAIRAKSGGTSQLAFPSGFVSEIGSIETGGGGDYVAADWFDMEKPEGDIVSGLRLSLYGQQSILNRRTKIANVTLTQSTIVPSYCFQASSIEKFVGVNVTVIGATAFSACTSLTAVDVQEIGTNNGPFASCSNLSTVVLRATTVGTIASNAFNNTPFASGKAGGTIYIHKSLYDELGTGTANDYKAATNWSVYDGYGTITWAQIEGSYYETHYADGTEIPTT